MLCFRKAFFRRGLRAWQALTTSRTLPQDTSVIFPGAGWASIGKDTLVIPDESHCAGGKDRSDAAKEVNPSFSHIRLFVPSCGSQKPTLYSGPLIPGLTAFRRRRSVGWGRRSREDRFTAGRLRALWRHCWVSLCMFHRDHPASLLPPSQAGEAPLSAAPVKGRGAVPQRSAISVFSDALAVVCDVLWWKEQPARDWVKSQV